MGWFTNRRTKRPFLGNQTRTLYPTVEESIAEPPELDLCDNCGKESKLTDIGDGTGMVCSSCKSKSDEAEKKETEELASKRLYGRDAIFEGFNPTYPTNTKKEEQE